VYGWYQDYIPSFVLSILATFPQHYVKIFVKDQLSETNKRCLDLIKKDISDHFEIIESFSELDWTLIPHLAAYRFLLTRDYFEGFDYIYFGDVDFIIYNEKEDQFFDTYLEHCKKTGLPFSNEWNYFGEFRMTGLHFVIKDRYFDIMDKWIFEMKNPKGNRFRRYKKPRYSYDEEMLYYMTFNAFDLRPLLGYNRPHHGLHFGEFRKLNSTDLMHDGYKKYLPTLLVNLQKINNIIKHDLFAEIYKSMCPAAKITVDKANLVLFNQAKKIFL